MSMRWKRHQTPDLGLPLKTLAAAEKLAVEGFPAAASEVEKDDRFKGTSQECVAVFIGDQHNVFCRAGYFPELAGGLFLSLLVSGVMWHFVESRVLRLKEKVCPVPAHSSA
jgi:hypothetical protein